MLTRIIITLLIGLNAAFFVGTTPVTAAPTWIDNTTVYGGYRFINIPQQSSSSTFEFGGGYRFVKASDYVLTLQAGAFLVPRSPNNSTSFFQGTIDIVGDYFIADIAGFKPFVSLGGGWLAAANPSTLGAEIGAGFLWVYRERWPLRVRYDHFFWGGGRRDQRISVQADFLFSDFEQSNIKVEKYDDMDGDSVPDINDLDNYTPAGAQVDERGRAVDSDLDHVADYADQCPDTPLNLLVDSEGCPADSDSDGISDGADQCAKTPVGSLVDKYGCPGDSDKDGIKDHLDQCANTPRGIKVDQNGCAPDADHDGVPNSLDECTETPSGIPVDQYGCAFDTDKDGIADFEDACPNTESNAVVDKNGCTIGIKNTIQFDVGKSNIGSKYNTVLAEITKMMSENQNITVELQGYADQTGPKKLNMALSLQRAKSVEEALVKQYKIDKNRLKTIGFGSEKLLVKSKVKSEIGVNRRVEVRVLFNNK